MPRIRSIKPEFPQSESMGRVSRDARLLFVLLWTICDDAGRTRAASRMLASLLFPYDEDAGAKIDGWLVELERESCIVRYTVGDSTYLQVCNWQAHQKIDRPSTSRIPPLDEGSRILANPREGSSLDRDKDLRTKDHSRGENAREEEARLAVEAEGIAIPAMPDWLRPWHAAYVAGVGHIAPAKLRRIVAPVRHEPDALTSWKLWCADPQLRRFARAKAEGWLAAWRAILDEQRDVLAAISGGGVPIVTAPEAA